MDSLDRQLVMIYNDPGNNVLVCEGNFREVDWGEKCDIGCGQYHLGS